MASNNSILARIGIGGLILILIGVASGIGIDRLFFNKPKVKTQVEYLTKDTCLALVKVAELTYDDSVSIYQLFSKSKGTTIVDKVKPAINKVEVVKKDTVETKITSFHKRYGSSDDLQSGTIYFQIEHTGDVKLTNFEHTYTVDTVKVKEIVNKNNTVILTPEVPQIIKPIETIKIAPKLARYGITGGLKYTDKLFYGAGVYYETKSGLQIAIEKYINNQGMEIDVSIPIGKIQ